MSYEGHERYLCKNGHYWKLDAYETMYKEEKEKCPICEEEEIWNESVDETNGEGNPTKLNLDSKKTKICKCCRTILQPVYLIPGDVLDVKEKIE